MKIEDKVEYKEFHELRECEQGDWIRHKGTVAVVTRPDPDPTAVELTTTEGKILILFKESVVELVKPRMTLK